MNQQSLNTAQPDILTEEDTLFALSEGSFSDEAARIIAHHTGSQVKNVASITDVWSKIREGETGLIPIENSNAGIVWPHLKDLRNGSYRIIGEMRHSIRMCAAARERVTLDDATMACSHHKALEQSSDWLNHHPNLRQNSKFDSTVDAARFVAEHPELLAVALGTRTALEKNGLVLLDDNIADTPAHANITRMYLVRNHGEEENPDASLPHHALTMKLENYDGALHDATGILRQAVGLNSVHSRNLGFSGGEMQYEFFMQMTKRNAHDEDSTRRFSNMVTALHALVGKENVRWLGSWQSEYSGIDT